MLPSYTGLYITGTVSNTVISPNFLMSKFPGVERQFPHSFGRFTFPRNPHTRKLGEITVFHAVMNIDLK